MRRTARVFHIGTADSLLKRAGYGTGEMFSLVGVHLPSLDDLLHEVPHGEELAALRVALAQVLVRALR